MEGFGPDTYGEAFADVYDQWYGNVSDPVGTARYVEGRCGSGPVLELGVGSGRLAAPLTQRGLPVVGLDTSRSMLERCRQAAPAVALVRGDMAAVPLRGPFGAILCAFNTVFNLPSLEAQRAVLAEARRLLGPDGVLILEAVTGDDLAAGPSSSVGVSRMTADHVVLTATLLDAGQQVLQGQHVELSAAGIRLRPWRLRWITPPQLDALAAEEGLVLVERHGDWDERPFDDDGPRHVSTYRRA